MALSGQSLRPGSATHGFVFADLRGYTQFAESHGSVAAAELLDRYRGVVRRAVARFGGAEVKTEGDSFFVVFASVSDAVLCGAAIVEDAAEEARDNQLDPIKVGVGIHAGETVDNGGDYVGSAVNVAARICARAVAGEVLVSDTVRSLTQGVVPMAFIPGGRPRLKGVAEPVALFRIDVAGPGRRAAVVPRRIRTRWLAGAVAMAVLVVLGAYAVNRLQSRVGLPPGVWKIGVSLPLQPDYLFRSQPILNGINLAIAEVNAAGGIAGSMLALDVRDDLGADQEDTAVGAAVAGAFVADPSIVAMVGPNSSQIATGEIPITNAAGLLQCSPSNSRPSLTKPRFGGLDTRAANPTRINYVRLATTDDAQGPAAAAYAFHNLRAKHALLIDDTSAFGRLVADAFDKAFVALGGRVDRRAVSPDGSNAASALSPLGDGSGADPVDLVYFGGEASVALPLRAAMASSGRAGIPFVGSDAIYDGSAADGGSYLSSVGSAAAGSYASRATTASVRADFTERYRRAYNSDPDAYSGPGYACVQVIVSALRDLARSAPDAAALRGLLRGYAVDPTHRYDTVLGSLSFDANGDSIQQVVIFYRAASVGGVTTWVVDDQQDYGPPQ